MQKGGWVYILTNKHHTVLYTGVTSDLQARMMQHITGYYTKAFTSKYSVRMLVYFQLYESIEEAIAGERITSGNRKNKIQIIEKSNPRCEDLWVNEVSKW